MERKYGESRDNCLNICLVRSGIAHRFLRSSEIITSSPPRDGDNQGWPAPLIWTGLMTPPQPWFAANVSIENIDTIVINVKVNNGRKITDVNFGNKTPITIDNTVIYGKRWTKKAAKIKTLQAILNQTKHLLFCPFSRGHLQHHLNRDQN